LDARPTGKRKFKPNGPQYPEVQIMAEVSAMTLLDSTEWLMVIGGYLRPDCEEQYKGIYFGSVPLNVVQELRELR
jgi:hypothetical protein